MIIALIPAKGNSSRLKNKNLLKINGKSLLERAIIDCKKSTLLNACYVSTDSKDIIKISKKYKVNVIKRPKKLSNKNTPIKKVIKHFINNLKRNGILPKTIVLIQPTSPYRPKKIIDKFIKEYNKNKLRSLITTKEIKNSYFKSIIKVKDKFIIKHPNFFFSNSQELPKIYLPNGMIYIFDVKKFNEIGNIPLTKIKFIDLKLKKDIDIDDKKDYLEAKNFYEKKTK